MKNETTSINTGSLRGHPRSNLKRLALLGGLAFLSAFSAAHAQTVEPFDNRFYVSPMYSRIFSDNDRLTRDGNGAILAVGKPLTEKVSFELYALGARYDVESGSGSADLYAIGGAASIFPFRTAENSFLGGFYVLVGVAFGDGSSDARTNPSSDQRRYVYEGGLGYLLPLFRDAKLRLDARYRYDETDESFDGTPTGSNSGFEEPVVSVGLLVPIGAKPVPPPLAPVLVVPVLSACGDSQDNDGDGAIDFPNDSGCLSKDDNDETNPQCSDGIDNDGDGLIDFPSDKGCTAADDVDEVDLCKKPAPGERINLSGCSAGDVIVLRGVNFEFDKSRLTANAKTILDNVADELKAYPGIAVELSGHTDSKGADESNQTLSERRAQSVVNYLTEKGVDGSRLAARGFGESQAVADNETEAGRELNRRVELRVTGSDAPAPIAPSAGTIPGSNTNSGGAASLDDVAPEARQVQ